MVPPLWGGGGTSVVRNRTRIAHRGCRSGQSFASAKVAHQGISPGGHLDPQPPPVTAVREMVDAKGRPPDEGGDPWGQIDRQVGDAISSATPLIWSVLA